MLHVSGHAGFEGTNLKIAEQPVCLARVKATEEILLDLCWNVGIRIPEATIRCVPIIQMRRTLEPFQRLKRP